MDLQPGDRAGSRRITVISEAFAQRHFKKNTSPLGRQIIVFSADGPIEIVGVVKDLREQGLSGPVPPVMYVPVAQASDAAIRTSHTYFESHWVIRAAAITPDLTRRIREELRALDPKQPVTSIRSMAEVKAARHGDRDVPDNAADRVYVNWPPARSGRDLRADCLLGRAAHS